MTENQEIKQLINTQLEKTKILKNKLDDVKDDLFSDYAQDEEESKYPDILDHFTGFQKEYNNKVNKLLKDQSAKASPQALCEELDSRINEIKKMRDGAEMDLDLDITTRMLENDEKDVKNMADVSLSVDQGCNMLENENMILEGELLY